MVFRLCLLIVVFVLNTANKVSGQHNSLFASRAVLRIEVFSDLQTLLNDIGDDRKYHNALLVCSDQGEKLKLDVEIQTRGNFRRDSGICKFPPLRLDFKKAQIKGTLFEGSDKIKLVTHCNTDDPVSVDNVYAEYLIYKIYNLLSSFSYQVRLAEITYHDIMDQTTTLTYPGFFIEKTGNVAKRSNLVRYEPDKIDKSKMSPGHYKLFAVFQFLVGNSDWSVLLPKNVSFVAEKDTSMIYPMPYDFDMTRFVSPDYMDQVVGFDMEGGNNFLKGYCNSLDDFVPAINAVLAKREAILSLVSSFKPMSGKKRREIINYLDNQFEILEDLEVLGSFYKDYCNE